MRQTLRKRMLWLCLASAVALTAQAQDIVTSTFNATNVILPSSQYTPDKPYDAWVYVVNNNERYTDDKYNVVLGTPPDDAQGRPWYAYDYEMTDDNITWTEATAPFSSDESYKSHTSYRWAVSEIMADMYMRRSFTLDGDIPGTVYMTVGHDDAPSEWYINGTKIHTVADGWNNDEYILLTDEQKALLKTDGSENVIAVHVHQNWGGAFADCGLYAADMALEHPYLNTITNGDPWDCLYYTLNYNSDLTDANNAQWYGDSEDESDWIAGKGPFSNDDNMFYTTEWGSQVHPILIRRHFNLTAADIEAINAGKLVLTCSYDENPTMYLNGSKIWSATGWNDNNYAEQSLRSTIKKKLRVGDNILAVSLTQGGGGGHIDYGLKLVSPYTPTGIGSVATDGGTRPADNRVYDLSGRCLGTSTEGLARGIYIVNGKKITVNK